MKHNIQNKDFEFCHEPVSFNKWSEKNLLQYCLGGTLYMPGTRAIVDKILTRGMPELTSMVMCFEDAIRVEDLPAAEDNVLQQLMRLADEVGRNEAVIDDIPLIFLRVRNPEQFISFASRLTTEQARILSGFVFPKFRSNNASVYLGELNMLSRKHDVMLYGMPLLEGREIAYSESRTAELASLKSILSAYREMILNIRVGGTDFSSIFGVRRGINSSIYDILPVRDALSEILNFFNRVEDGYIVSGPVWEYFLAYNEDDLAKLIGQQLHRSLLAKEPIINEAIDGLLREVMLDKTNGFVGKTVIHPSHLKYVNAMQAVTLEEYEDACQILDNTGGVIKSAKANKMNEMNPHRNWAERLVQCGMTYGVIKDENEYAKLFLS